MKFFMLINIEMPILKFMSKKNSIKGLAEPEKNAEFLDMVYTYEHFKFHAQLN